jgi:hypothetical protein
MADLPSPVLPEIVTKGHQPAEPEAGMIDGDSELVAFERKTMYVFWFRYPRLHDLD